LHRNFRLLPPFAAHSTKFSHTANFAWVENLKNTVVMTLYRQDSPVSSLHHHFFRSEFPTLWTARESEKYLWNVNSKYQENINMCRG
jgi:hypothetical protein